MQQFVFCSGFKREFCNWETFNANCTRGHVIMMTAAQYGRMRFGRCIRRAYDDDHNPLDVGTCFFYLGATKSLELVKVGHPNF